MHDRRKVWDNQMGRMSCSETSAFSQVNSYFLRKIDLVQLRIIFPCKPFLLFISWVKTYPCLISYQLNGSERISTMYLKTVIFRHSILDNSSIPLTPAKQRSIFYQNITDSVKKDPPMQNKTTLYGMSGIE